MTDFIKHFHRLVLAFDGESFKYESDNKMEDLLKRVRKGPEEDLLNFYRDMYSAFAHIENEQQGNHERERA